MWVVVSLILFILIVGEAVFILPDKMPWNKRRKKK